MNILIFSWRGPGHPQAGGAEISTHEHAKYWSEQGHKVTLFTSVFEDAQKEVAIDGIKIIRSGRQIFGVQLNAFLWYFFGNHPKFDLVIDQFHGIPFFTPLYVRGKKLAFIHEVTKEVWRLNPWPKPFNLLPALVGYTLEPLMFKLLYKSTPFMTVSESTKKDLVEWGINKKNITVIHNGVTLIKPSSFPKKEKVKTVMFLGALSKDKGVEDAIEIFSLINQIDHSWHFWVVGNGEALYLSFLKNKVEKLSLGSSVKFWGFVNERQKFDLLARAHVMLNTSFREGWGLVNIEANCMKTPVVGYKVPGVVDSVKNGTTGVLLNSGDMAAIAEAIVKLINNKDRYLKMQKEATGWAKKFKWEVSGKQSVRLIESLQDIKIRA